MKRLMAFFALAPVLIIAGTPSAHSWKKYSSSTSFSFHYPVGWQVSEQESVVAITNPSTQEELLILALPFAKNSTPLALANQTLGTLRTSLPDLKGSGFRSQGANAIAFQCTYSEKGTPFRSEVLVVKDATAAHWFSYSAPKAGYNQVTGLDLLQGMVGSLAAGSASKPPIAADSPLAATSSSLEKNARAFLFVLEFTLGAPLNHAQEQLILTELVSSWQAQSPESLKPYDLYPKVVSAILGGDQHKVEQLRNDLEQSTREWLEISDPSDRVVKLVRAQLNSKTKPLVAGNPPLTEMAATAYSELMTFAALVAVNRNAQPTSLSPADVGRLRQRLQQSWPSLAAAERRDILSTPGLWISFRTVLQFGSPAEQEKIRTQLLRLNPSPSPSASPSGQASPRPMGMVEHNVLMNINQMTFNSYLWSRGFKTTMGGY